MKKTYQKPEVELTRFDSKELILEGETVNFASMQGEEGFEEW